MRPFHKILIPAILCAATALPLLMAAEYAYDRALVAPSQPTTWQGAFKTIATLSDCNGTLAAADRDYATVAALPDANCTIWEIPIGAGYAQFRFQIDADGNTATVEAWAAAHRYDPGTGTDRDQMDDFTLAWQFALTGGAQTGPNSNVFVDTIVPTETWPAVGVTSDSAGNRICRYDVDLRGVKYLAWIRTDTDANLTVYIDARLY